MGVGFAAVLAAVFAAAATGLSGAVAVLERRSAPVPSLTLASALACIALLALAGTSLMQLDRPQLIFAAFSNPASSIFKLGVAWIVALAACAAYLAAIHRAAYESTCRKLALVASVAAALVLMAHASNYVMPWRAAWNTWSIVLPFFGYAALIGVATMGLVGAVHGYALDRRVSLAAGGFAVFGLALYLVIVGGTDAVELTASRVLTGDLATWFWGLTVGAGIVLPWGLTLLARQSRVALTAALFAALVGCAGWQIVVLRLGSAAWSFFAR